MHKNSLWYHPDTLKYELLECTLLFDRFHSQYTHELRDTCAHDPKRNWPNSECRMPQGSNPGLAEPRQLWYSHRLSLASDRWQWPVAPGSLPVGVRP